MKNGLRKTWLAAMCLLLCAALLGGCADKQQPQTPAFGTADNEIFTYTPVEQGKTPLVVSVTGNLGVSIDHIIEQFEQEHPDVQVFYLDITGGTNAERPYLNWIERGPTPDIMFMGNTMYQSIDMKKSFVNLSSTPYLEVFHTDSLNRLQVDGDIYVLPGPSSVTCMVYNKTLFERYGWEVPGTFDEFVTLCARIKADTNGAVEPWNPNAKYDGEIVKALQGFFYASLFAGVENRTLYNQFIAGGEGYAEHIRPMFEGVQRLVDEGIIRNEHFTYSATSRQNEFVAGKIAMINVPAKRIDSDEYTFGYMPFPGENPGDGYIADTLSCTVGMTKKERGEKELAAAEAFMAFYASVETQKLFIEDSFMVSNVKDVPDHSDDLAALMPTINAGHMFMQQQYQHDGLMRGVNIYSAAKRMTEGTFDLESTLAAIEASKPQPIQKNTPSQTVVAKVAEDFTILEFSNYLADMFREIAGADVGLVINNSVYRGNVMRVYTGDIKDEAIAVYKPRSFANGSTLVKATMTGRQLLDALNAPVSATEGEPANAVYAFSGLKATYAPWKPLGEKVVSVTLANGNKIDESKQYTVAFWDGTVPSDCITGTPASIEGTFEELFTKTLREDGEIAPAKDGRVTLQWQ